jgi:hypothetical protein
MMKEIIILTMIMVVLGATAIFMIRMDKVNNTGFEVGERVMIKDSENCNCVIENTWRYSVSIVCSSHNGVTHETVNPKILEPCNEDIKY